MVNEETVLCLECKRTFRSITNTHLAKHQLTNEQYREKYNISLVLPLKCQRLIREAKARPAYIRDNIWRQNASKKKKGPKNPRYKNGNPLKNRRYTGKWQFYYRLEALRRDDFKCQHCGMTQDAHYTQYGSSLHVHHIDSTILIIDGVENKNHQLENLITLCKRCHIIEDNRGIYGNSHQKHKKS